MHVHVHVHMYVLVHAMHARLNRTIVMTMRLQSHADMTRMYSREKKDVMRLRTEWSNKEKGVMWRMTHRDRTGNK